MIAYSRVTKTVPIGGMIYDYTLSCGHVTRRLSPNQVRPPRKLRCRECETRGEKTNPDPRLTRQRRERTAATMFARIIKLRDRQCTMAGRDGVRCAGSLDCAHVITRVNHVLRFDPRNAHLLCRTHHTYYHANEAEWIEVSKREWPEATAYCLMHRHLLEPDEDLEAIIESLRRMLKKLEK